MTAFETVLGGMRRAALAGVLMLLAACQTPTDRLYTLSVLPGAGAAGATPAALALGSLELPPLVDRPQLVRRIDANRVEALEFDRWAEPLADGLRATLAGDLAARLPGRNVLPVAGAAPGPGVAVLSVTILKFEGEANGRVVLDAHWTLGSGPRRRDTLEVQGASGEPAALVAAMSQAVALLADRVVAGR
ncbi:PqiC family protein [Azospirillum doebereinerae]|uniref:PqiC family protein n=1 Tax=Azospirillum doebereinerae TaxID=92933 RepID=UPI001EE60970|nr:PqiC family protein [Azospirillum doebereinerae]MCG5240548.1 PqiC family protein [Azospirillum doebereinerae]